MPKLQDVVSPLEAAYKAQLRGMVQAWAKRIARALEPLLREYGRTREDAVGDPRSVVARLRDELKAESADVTARRTLERLERRSREAANAQVAPLTGDTPLWRGLSSTNKSVLVAGFERGAHVDVLRSELMERYGVAESRAELIARDQLGKMNGQLAEARAREIGVDEYIWRVSGGVGGDGRNRPMHLKLEGTKHRYDDPPVTNEDGDTNNPGEDFQCRCTTEPAVDALLDALLA